METLKNLTSLGTTLLQDPVTEEAENTSDRVAVTTSALSSSLTQHAVRTGGTLDPAPQTPDVGVAGVETDLFIKIFARQVFLRRVEWGTGHGHMHELLEMKLTEDIFGLNRPARKLRDLWKYYHSGFKIKFECNTPTGSTGALLFVYVPSEIRESKDKWSTSTIFNFPHVILNAGNSTEVILDIPFVKAYPFANTRDNESMGSIIVYVLSQLDTASGMNTAVDVVIYGSLQSPTFVNPMVTEGPGEVNLKSRSTKFKYTKTRMIVQESMGAANLANATNTGSNHSSALGGERVFYMKGIAGSVKPVRDVKQVLMIPSMMNNASNMALDANISTFNWSATTAPGSSIIRYNMAIENLGNIGHVSKHYAGWNGSIVFEITVFSSVMHKGRLAVVIDQGSDSGGGFHSDVNLEKMNRLQYAILDLGINSTVELTVPYMRDSWMQTCSGGVNIFRLHLLVVTRLGYSSAAKNSVRGMIRVKAGRDFAFYFPRNSEHTVQAPEEDKPKSWGSMMDLTDPFEDEEKHQDVLEEAHSVTVEDGAAAEQVGLADAGNAGTLSEIVEMRTPTQIGVKMNSHRISCISYTDVFAIAARAFFITGAAYDAESPTIRIGIPYPRKDLHAVLNCFSYFASELNITVANESDGIMTVCHQWEHESGPLESAGVLVVPARQIVTFTAPFYSLQPMRPTVSDAPLGQLYMQPGSQGGYYRAWASFRCPNFFFPKPFHKAASTLLMLRKPELYFRTVDEVKDRLLGRTYARSPIVQAAMEALDEHDDSDLLTQCGDIEENPGPVWELVYQHKGLYKHYGVTDGDKVIHLNTDDILYSAVTGKATVISTKLDGSWVHTGEEAMLMENTPEFELGKEMKFTIDNNCEDFARKYVSPFKNTQGGILKDFAIICLTSSLLACLSTQDISTAMSALTETLAAAFSNDVVCRVLRFLLRITLYGILFCHAPGLLTGACVAGLVFMDIREAEISKGLPWVRGFFQASVQGDLGAMVDNLQAGLMEDEDIQKATVEGIKTAKKMTAQGFHEFNQFTLAFKNVEWWMDLLKRLAQKIKEMFRPATANKFAEVVEQHRDNLAQLFQVVSDMVKRAKKNGETAKKEFHELYSHTHMLVSHWLTGFNKYCPRHELAMTMAAALKKLDSLTLAPVKEPGTTRIEPVGILITGPPGQGKSFFTTALLKRVAKVLGWDVDDVFNHPTGSKFFDGYCGQRMHIIDDLGQASDDEDYRYLCQIISTVPFPVPMARLEEKATWYNSRIVAATTNRSDMITKTINTPEAIERRFEFKLHLKAKKQYLKDGKLNVAGCMEQMAAGKVWEDEAGNSVEVDQVADKVIQRLLAKELIHEKWNDYLAQAPTLDEDDITSWYNRLLEMGNYGDDSLFDDAVVVPEPKPTIKDKIKNALKAYTDFVTKHSHWFLFASVLSTVISCAGILWTLSKKKPPPAEENPQVYNGNPTMKPNKKTQFTKKEPEHVAQGPLDDLAHIRKCMIRLDADNKQVFGISIGEDKVLTYGHSFNILDNAALVRLHYRDKTIDLKNPEFAPIMINGIRTDLAIVKTNCGFNMINGLKFVAPINIMPQDGLLFWNTRDGFYSMEAKGLRLAGYSVTADGVPSHETITYRAQTTPGTCGGLLLCKRNGMYKIFGMHIAGNGITGRSVVLPIAQGVHQWIDPLPLPPVHMAKKSKLKPSPVHGVVEVKKEPAPLHDGDKRAKEKPSKQIVAKNVGNVFQPLDKKRFDQAVNNVRERLVEEVGVHGTLTLEEALQSLANPVDMDSSPGHKYTSQNLRKKDLFNPTTGEISEVLKVDVVKMMNEAERWPPDTYFTTAMKDELRGLDKIDLGKTRVIEASNFDYTCCFRMMFGKQMDIICLSNPLDTGLAMGINPYTDWTTLVKGLYQNVYDFDYKGFDGSLSDELLKAGLYAMAGTVEDEKRFLNLGLATVYSYHHSAWGDYYLHGSMPSGTPFTTVLNSVCNLILVEYHFLELTQPYNCVTYGDDLVISTPVEFDPAEFALMAREEFGMVVTPGDKSDTFKKKDPNSFEFLKRRTRWLTADTAVGVLDTENMLQAIMWCKGESAFKQQLLSFTLELALHGREIFDQCRELLKTKDVTLMKYDDASRQAQRVVYGL